MATADKTYTIPLHAGLLRTPRYKRAKKAVGIIKAYILRHSKTTDVKLGKYLNLKLWEHGIKNVAHKVRVTTTKNDKGAVVVELVGAPKEVKVEPKKKAETPSEKIAEKMQEVKAKKETEKSAGAKDSKQEKNQPKPAAPSTKTTPTDTTSTTKSVPPNTNKENSPAKEQKAAP